MIRRIASTMAKGHQKETFKMVRNTRFIAVILGAALYSSLFPAVAADKNLWPGTMPDTPAAKTSAMSPVLASNLANFDDLDFHVYTDQQWQDLHKSHAKDIVVHWPDGHITRGTERHIQDLEYMFTFAPDNRVTAHPVRFGTKDGEWTAVTGWLEGSFTRPMVLANGTIIAPTGQAYRIPMATVGHWNKQGVMDEEYLFWDNAEFMKQIGLGK